VSTEPQNIYDDPSFFAGYSQLERFGSGWSTALEQPLFLGLLPEKLEGIRALDLGCGAGQLSHYLATHGATDVLAVDVSETMIRLAEAERSHAHITYRVHPIETLQLPDSAYDLVVSSLAFHYIPNFAGLLRNIARWLTPGGTLVFSTEHPIYTARLPGEGWVLDDQGERVGWQIDHYFEEGLREERWFIEGVQKYHRTVSTLLNAILAAGLRIDRVIEPVPDEDRLRQRAHEVDERRRPMFLLVGASRPSSG
jgi:SAM-dependent methyltransferase